VHPYLLRGIVRCDLCGRKCRVPRADRGCGFADEGALPLRVWRRRSVPIGMDHRRPCTSVRTRSFRGWTPVGRIVTPEALASAQAMPPDVAAQHAAVRTAMADCDVRIKRLLESIESGSITNCRAKSQELQAERARLEATLGATTVAPVVGPVRSPNG